MPEIAPCAVLFDLDGTLADTAPDLGAALNSLRQELGLTPLPLQLLRPHTSQGGRGLLRVGLGLHPHDPDYQPRYQRFLLHYESSLCVHTRLFSGMAELLELLEQHRIPWGVVTNKSSRLTLPLLEQMGLHGRCACIVCGDSTPHPKPAPDTLLLAARQLDLAPARCIYLGDDLRDIQAGRASGMATVAVRWGYLGTESAPENWGADYLIDHPDQVPGLLKLSKLSP